jgi:hypothetical protein
MAGIDLGNTVGAAFLTFRANDGWNIPKPYTPGTEPGNWIPTPPAFAPATANSVLETWCSSFRMEGMNRDGVVALSRYQSRRPRCWSWAGF